MVHLVAVQCLLPNKNNLKDQSKQQEHNHIYGVIHDSVLHLTRFHSLKNKNIVNWYDSDNEI